MVQLKEIIGGWKIVGQVSMKGKRREESEGFFFRDGCSFAIMDGGDSGALCLVDIAAFFPRSSLSR